MIWTKLSRALLLAFLLAPALANAELQIFARANSEEIHLLGPDARQQIVVLSGQTDVTRQVQFLLEPDDVISASSTGYLTPLRDGSTRLTVSHGNDSASIQVQVTEFSHRQEVSFANDVIPILTRSHCNAGTCHAKATGQNGFQLSLLGFDPSADFEQLVLHGRGRRVTPAAPEASLLLQKPTGDIPHEGGVRWEKGSADYEVLSRWIEAGAIYDPSKDATVERIYVLPSSVVANRNSQQQLAVTAVFSDGSSRDITRLAQFESNQPEMATSGEAGLISLAEKSGSTSVLVRFQEHLAVFQALIPLGHEVASLPEAKNFVDQQIFKQLNVLGLPPSEECSDGSFVRRVTLAIAGRLPTVEETRAFLADNDPDKRTKKVDQLLETTDYADFFAGKWAALLRNKVNRGTEWVTRDSYAFHKWIRTSFLENKPFNQFAAELVQASGKAIENPAVSWYRVVKDENEQMQDISQVFLGVRMQCAQCHHHPYERWSQDDYYSFAAFFSTIERKNTRKLPEEDIVYHNRKAASMQNPVSREKLSPRLLGETEYLTLPPEQDPRRELAAWMGSPDNPWFARTFVNRYWKHFFGRGLAEPEDDIRPTNPATHPELLDELAASFIASKYDVKELIRTICNSQTWQLSSTANKFNEDDEQNYARFYPRRLQAEQLLDSINDLTGAENSFNEMPLGARAISLPNEEGNKQSEFLTMFGRPQMDAACECERRDEASLGQSLHLINADTVQAKLRTSNGRAVALAKDKERGIDERLTELYLQAWSREPEPSELALAKAHLEKHNGSQQAFEDVIWVLLNTKEFMFTH